MIDAPVSASRLKSPRPEAIGIVVAIDSDATPALSVGDVIVHIDSRYYWSAEVDTLFRDPSEVRSKLGWIMEITIQEMCTLIVAHDLRNDHRTHMLLDHGFDSSISIRGSGDA